MADLLAHVPGLAERIMAYTQADLIRLCDGPSIYGFGSRSWGFSRDGDGRWGPDYSWQPPSGVAALDAALTWSIFPDDYPDPDLVRLNRIEVVTNVAKISGLSLSEVLVWIEESRHPLEQLALEAL